MILKYSSEEFSLIFLNYFPSKICSFKRLFNVEWNGAFRFVISFLFQRYSSFQFSCYANLVTDDVIGCASTVVRQIKNISANNETMLVRATFFRDEWEVAHDGKNDNPHILPRDTLWSVNKRGEFFLFKSIYIL